MRYAVFLFLTSLVLLARSSEAANLALIIGVGDYVYLGDLGRSPNDAEDVATLFSNKGFRTFLLKDARTKKAMEETIDAFVAEAKKIATTEDVNIIVYYSGHGFEAERNNWLVAGDFDPTGVKKSQIKRVFQRSGVTLTQLLSKIHSANGKNAVLILDACREKEVEIAPSAVMSPGFDVAMSEIPDDFFVLYASKRQSVAHISFDPSITRNSVFTYFFLRDAVENLELSALSNRLQIEVLRATANKKPRQSPTYYDGIPGDYYMFPQQPSPPSAAGQVDSISSRRVSQEGPPISIFFRESRLLDAQVLGNLMKARGLFYGLVPDELNDIKARLPKGSYRVVRSSVLSPQERAAYDEVLGVLDTVAGKDRVIVSELQPNQIINKPFQIQLF